MDEAELNTSLLLQNQKLRREVEDLKTLWIVMRENVELHSRLDSFLLTRDTATEKSQMCAGQKSMLPDSFVDESSFRAGLIAPRHVSSPLRNTHSQSARPDTSPRLSDPERLLGEIGFQLERRILSHVFYKQTRLYGFTVQNIQDKIVQVSTHPLTGQVDMEYRTELSKRHVELMGRLGALGYNMTLHPPFTEFIINTYGILKDGPDAQMAWERGYTDLNVLRCVMVETTPSGLLKDLLVLFSCLCYLAEKDGKPLILW